MKWRYALTLAALSTAFLLLSFVVVFPGMLAVGDHIREESTRVLALTLQSASPEAMETILTQARNELQSDLPIVGVWALDENGRAVMSWSPDRESFDWNALPHPSSPREITRAREAMNTYTLVQRLEKGPAAFLVVRFARFGLALKSVAISALIFSLWLVLGSVAIATALVFTYVRTRAAEARVVFGRITRGEWSARFRATRMDEAGKLMALFNRLADEIERLVTRLHEAQTARTRLLQELSHDTRTPLTAARTTLDTLDLNWEGLDENDRRRCAAIARHETQYLSQLIEDLFFLAEMEDPRYRRDTDSVDLGELVTAEIENRRGGGLRWEIVGSPPTDWKIPGTPRLLLRLFRNAFDNTAKYARTTVRVRFIPNGIVIEDDGPGASPEALAHFGERRAQRPGALASGQSLGLGSVIMKHIAALHDGEVRLSNGPSGARLEITLNATHRFQSAV